MFDLQGSHFVFLVRIVRPHSDYFSNSRKSISSIDLYKFAKTNENIAIL